MGSVLDLAGRRIEGVLCGPGGGGDERERVYLLLEGGDVVDLELPCEQGGGAVVPGSEQSVRGLAARRGGVTAERFSSQPEARRFRRPGAELARAGSQASMRLVVARSERPVTDKRDLVRVVGRAAHYIRKLLSTPEGLNAAEERAFDLEARRLGEAVQRRFMEHWRAMEPLGLEDGAGCAAYLTLRDMDDLVREEDRAATVFFLDFVHGLVTDCARQASGGRAVSLPTAPNAGDEPDK